MIGSLRGTVLDRVPPGEVLVEVAGVGYRALVPPGLLADLRPGAAAFLHTHLHVREDALTLYGFGSRDERACFEALLGAHGVGPSLALAILSVHTPPALRRAVLDGDVGALCLVPGVGKKTAARLLVELRERLHVPDLEIEPSGPSAGLVAGPRAEVREALEQLGYGPDEVREALRGLPVDGDGAAGPGGGAADVPALLREALQRLGARR